MKKCYEMKLVLLLCCALPLVSCSAKHDTAGAEMHESEEYVELKNEKERIEGELSSTRSDLMDSESQLASQQQINKELESDLDTAEVRIENLEEQVAESSDTLLPANAKSGECFARVLIPSQFRTVSEQVLKTQAAETFEIIPAEYETVTESVIVKDGHTGLELTEAEYEWREESVMVEPAKTAERHVPAVFEMVTEEVMIKPARMEWKKGTGPIQKIDNATGEIVCLTEVPAEYETVTKKVVKEPARTETVEIPAVYKTIKKKVLVTPPQVKEFEVPAELDEIQVTKLKTPASQKIVQIPAEYQTVTKKELINDSQMQWISILCQTNSTPEKIKDVQQALLDSGFDPGPIDGNVGKLTVNAMNEFQLSKGLVVSKYLTLETMEALNVPTN